MTQLNFNPQSVAPAQPFEVLPAGWYTGMIVESEMKPTKDNMGSYLMLTIEIVCGDYAKRKVFDRLNLVNKNPTAVDIAYRTLSAICHAIGHLNPVNDSQELHGRPFAIKLAVSQGQFNQQTGQQYEPSNDVKGYKAVDMQNPEMGPSKAAQVAGAVMGGAGAPAWATGGQPAQGFQQPQAAPQGWGGQQAAGFQQPQQGFQQPQGFPQPQQPAAQQAAAPVWAQQQPQQVQPQNYQNGAQPTQPAQQQQPAATATAQGGSTAMPNSAPAAAQQATNVPQQQPWANGAAQSAQPASQPAQQAAQPAAQANSQPPATAANGAPPWAQGGQPAAQAPAQQPPWLQQGGAQ